MFGWFRKSKSSPLLIQRRTLITTGISALALSVDGSATMREKKWAQASYTPMAPDRIPGTVLISGVRWDYDNTYPSSRIVYEDGTATKWFSYKGLPKRARVIETRTMDMYGRIRYVQHKID